MAALLNWTRLRSAVILSKCGQGSAVEIVGWLALSIVVVVADASLNKS
jgi:hypothetical protein